MRNILRAAVAAAAIAIAALAGGSSALATNDQSVVVCKYVSTPGVGEVLQTGQNPIVVSSNALTGKGFDGTFPFTFSDAQGQSIAIRYATSAQDGDISECPGGAQPSTEPTPTPSQSVSPTPTPTPSNSPEPSETASPSPSVVPSPSTTPEPTPVPSSTSSPTPSESATHSSIPSPSLTLPPTDTAGGDPDGTADPGSWTGLFAGIGFVAVLYGAMTYLTKVRIPASRRANGRRDW